MRSEPAAAARSSLRTSECGVGSATNSSFFAQRNKGQQDNKEVLGTPEVRERIKQIQEKAKKFEIMKHPHRRVSCLERGSNEQG
jgi:hypothetical protein